MEQITRLTVGQQLRKLVRRSKMIVEVKNVSIANVWEESFKDRETGEDVKFFRALLSKAGEAPSQVAVSREDFDTLAQSVGAVGTAVLEIDAQPGRRVRVYLKGVK